MGVTRDIQGHIGPKRGDFPFIHLGDLPPLRNLNQVELNQSFVTSNSVGDQTLLVPPRIIVLSPHIQFTNINVGHSYSVVAEMVYLFTKLVN